MLFNFKRQLHRHFRNRPCRQKKRNCSNSKVTVRNSRENGQSQARRKLGEIDEVLASCYSNWSRFGASASADWDRFYADGYIKDNKFRIELQIFISVHERYSICDTLSSAFLNKVLIIFKFIS